jgi:hypothetical protein
MRANKLNNGMKITRLLFMIFSIMSILYLNNLLFTINSDILFLSSIIPVKSDYSKDKFSHVISQDQLEILDKNIQDVIIGSLLPLVCVRISLCTGEDCTYFLCSEK